MKGFRHSRQSMQSEETLNLAARFRAIRLARGVSLRDLAEQLGMTYQNLSRMEHGFHRFFATDLRNAAEFMQVPLELFFTDDTKRRRVKSVTLAGEVRDNA